MKLYSPLKTDRVGLQNYCFKVYIDIVTLDKENTSINNCLPFNQSNLSNPHQMRGIDNRVTKWVSIWALKDTRLFSIVKYEGFSKNLCLVTKL